MERTLDEYSIGGLKTTIPFYRHILNNKAFCDAAFDTSFVADTPELMNFQDMPHEGERLTRLVAEISARGYNPYVQLGEYRTADTPRLPEFNPVLPSIPSQLRRAPSPYPREDRAALLSFLRDSGKVHLTDTTTRDGTQSNSGNRFRLAEDQLVGPYLDNCSFFSLENGGGAHFHVAMMANMTYPFSEAAAWNRFAPKTLKQILVRSTNVLGYTPQPRNLMQITGEMICDHYQLIRCFDFLNDIRNMRPLAEVVMSRGDVVFEPAVSLSWTKGFDVEHYLGVTEATLDMVASVMGATQAEAARNIILGLKDMAGLCPPRFMKELVGRCAAAGPNSCCIITAITRTACLSPAWEPPPRQEPTFSTFSSEPPSAPTGRVMPCPPLPIWRKNLVWKHWSTRICCARQTLWSNRSCPSTIAIVPPIFWESITMS